MKIIIYQNKRNSHKFIEVHNDGYYHYAIRQFLLNWNKKSKKFVVYMVGDQKLHRWKKENLNELLEDYKLYIDQETILRKLNGEINEKRASN